MSIQAESRVRVRRAGIPLCIGLAINPCMVAGVVVIAAAPLLRAELPGESENDAPDTVADLLECGLRQVDVPSILRWRECHANLVEAGADATQADIALALIYARAGRHHDAWKLLADAHDRSPRNLQVLRLLAWARLSDRRIAEGLKDVSVLVSRTQDPGELLRVAEVESILTFAGKAFGFGLAVVESVQMHEADRVNKLRRDVVAGVAERDRAVFERAEDEARDAIETEVDDVLASQDETIQDQQADKTREQARLAAEQQALEAEGAQRVTQAAAVEQRAYELLGQLQQRMAPLIQRRNILQSQLYRLQSARSAEKEEGNKKRYDPEIALVQGEISGLNSELAGLEAQFASTSQQASGVVTALGSRYRFLKRYHHMNSRRLSKNDGRAATGLTPKVAQELRVRTKLATYVPLDFAEETKTLLRDVPRG